MTIDQYILDHPSTHAHCRRKVGAGAVATAPSPSQPLHRRTIGTVPKATLDEVREAFAIGPCLQATLSRFERAAILNKAAAIVRQRTRTRSPQLITAEAGLC
jgi:acyl-CoA reductase-like NAD-dependent aldehyde dehydrogenase